MDRWNRNAATWPCQVTVLSGPKSMQAEANPDEGFYLPRLLGAMTCSFTVCLWLNFESIPVSIGIFYTCHNTIVPESSHSPGKPRECEATSYYRGQRQLKPLRKWLIMHLRHGSCQHRSSTLRCFKRLVPQDGATPRETTMEWR
jgi:hypothetical protein